MPRRENSKLYPWRIQPPPSSWVLLGEGCVVNTAHHHMLRSRHPSSIQARRAATRSHRRGLCTKPGAMRASPDTDCSWPVFRGSEPCHLFLSPQRDNRNPTLAEALRGSLWSEHRRGTRPTVTPGLSLPLPGRITSLVLETRLGASV